MTGKLTDRQLRFVWSKAIWFCVKAFKFRDAFEAWRNSWMAHPPVHWSNGVRIYEEKDVPE